MHNAINPEHTWSGDTSFSPAFVCSIICEKWSESLGTFCTIVALATQTAALMLVLKKLSYQLLLYAIFARLLTVAPISCTEQAALNYMNTNMFRRRPKEVLDDSMKALSCN